jgi:APA family basic amino acid/polyamine antiporter
MLDYVVNYMGCTVKGYKLERGEVRTMDISKAFRKKTIEESIQHTKLDGRSLKKELGTFDVATLGVSAAIGAGIFSVSALTVSYYAGPSTIFSFLLAGLIMLLGIMSYVELGSRIPVAGSAYSFAYITMGELPAWLVAWCFLVQFMSACAAVARYWGVYFSQAFASFGLNLGSTITTFKIGSLPITIDFLTIVVVIIFSVLLAAGTKLSARVTSIFVAIKVIAILLLIGIGIFFVKSSNLFPMIPAEQASEIGDQETLLSLFAPVGVSAFGLFGVFAGATMAFFSYSGFDSIISITEETKDPKRSMPRGIIIGLLITTVLYVAVVFVISGMVNYRDLAAQGQDNVSLATAFLMVGSADAAKIISVGSLIAITTVLIAMLMASARFFFSLSRDNFLPNALGKAAKRTKTPVNAQILVAVLTIIMGATLDLVQLAQLIGMCGLATMITVSVSAIIIRRREKKGLLEKDTHGFRMPFGIVIPIASICLTFWVLLNTSIFAWKFLLIWTIIGIVVYLLYGFRKAGSIKSNAKEATE